MTFEEMFDIYVRYKLDRKRCKRVSVYTTERRLTTFLEPVWTREPRDFTADSLVSLLEAYSDDGRRANETVHGSYREIRAMLRWMSRKNYVSREWTQSILESDAVQDALADYPRQHKVREQLFVNDARLFRDFAQAEANENPRGPATGGLIALLLDLRAGEIISRQARHIDDDGRLLWVTDAKTKTGERTLCVADENLRATLLRAVEGLRPVDRVFCFTRHCFHEAVKRICRDAGVPEVGPHGLRRTFATLATSSGAAESAVAQALGHTSFEGMTRKHYVAPGTVEQVHANAVHKRLRSV
jgi:integrase